MYDEFLNHRAHKRLLTYSSARRWLACRRQFYFRYFGQCRKPANLPMMEGSLLHGLLESEARFNQFIQTSDFYNGDVSGEVRERDQDPQGYAQQRLNDLQPFIQAWREEALAPLYQESAEDLRVYYSAEDVEKSLTLNTGVFRNWLRVHGASDLERYEVIAVELGFAQEMLNRGGGLVRGWDLGGKIDLALRDLETGISFLREYKTTSGDPRDYERRVALDPQVRIYANALERSGILGDDPVGYVQYAVLRRKIPTLPRDIKCKSCKGKGELKDGACGACKGSGQTVSFARTVDSVRSEVRAYLLEREIDIHSEAASKFLDGLPGWEKFFSLTTHYLDSEDVQETLSEMRRVANEIDSAVKWYQRSGNLAWNFPKNVSHCSGPTGYCDFTNACKMRMKAEEISKGSGFIHAPDHPELEEEKKG